MSETKHTPIGAPNDNQAAMATRGELAEGAQRHYVEVSSIAHEWCSVIPKAIDAWEREPDLLAALQSIADCTDPDNDESYRADDPQGCLETVNTIAVAAIARTKGETS